MDEDLKKTILGISPAAVGSITRHVLTGAAGFGITVVSLEKTDAAVQFVVYVVSAAITLLTLLWSRKSDQSVAMTASVDTVNLIRRGESASRIGPVNGPANGQSSGGNGLPPLLPALLLMLSVSLAMGLVMGGCASNGGTVGQTFTQGDNARELRNGGPITLAVDTPTGAVTDGNGDAVLDQHGKPVVPVESVSTSSTGPGGYVVADGTQTRGLLNNTVIRNVHFSKDEAGRIIFNSVSGTDVRATADSLVFNPSTGELQGSGLKFETLASTPFDSSNQSLIAWRDAFNQQTQAQKDAAIAQINATADLLKNTVPSVAGELTKIAQFLMAK